MAPRVRCRAVFLDAGGVIVLPHRELVRAALAAIGVEVDPALVPDAHYRTAAELDRIPSAGYLPVFVRALGVAPDRADDAVAALSTLADRKRSGQILWSEPAPSALRAMAALRRAGLALLVVTNSDGHAEENLRDAGICQTGTGAGAVVSAVIDSVLVGSEKPDPGIFEAALELAQVEPGEVVHVGDMVSADVAAARAAGVTPIHLDPHRRCRARDHRHVRELSGIWRHVASAAR